MRNAPDFRAHKGQILAAYTLQMFSTPYLQFTILGGEYKHD